ncbi:MAG: hypothetical protein Ct9H300mP14_14500 [Gammaproteobacteria bacterium]|nr:MAG: hypothetical protein Ct9H300mP14_14500 [Gammaproteobacteria bacterium]
MSEKDSPSCGMARSRCVTKKECPIEMGSEYFSNTPTGSTKFPIEEEGRLHEPVYGKFIERIFAFQRLNRLFTGRWTPQVVAFNPRIMQLMAITKIYRDLGQRVATVKGLPRSEFRDGYIEIL